MNKKFSLWGFLPKVHADVTTARDEATGFIRFDDATRTVYAKEIEFKALPLLRFYQFATVKTELGATPGMTISMLSYDNLRLGGAILETETIKTQAMTGFTKQIAVTEYTNAVAVSNLLLETSFLDVMADAVELLSRDYALVLDMTLRDAAMGNTSNVIYAGGAANRAGLDADSKFTVSTVKDAIEVLATNNTPKVGGTSWVCFVHPHQSRDLRDDPAWISASQYGAPDQLFSGEIGRIDDTRFIDTSILPNGAAPVEDPAHDPELVTGEDGNQVDVYKAVLFGANYYGIAWALPMELRDNGVEDFGRIRSLAWYAIFGVGLLHDEYGVVIESA